MASPQNPESAEPRWILVADGDEASANRLADLLRRQGFWAYSTARGADALRLACTLRLALAVIDVALQDMDGHELARCIRGIDSALPVVMTSADPCPEAEVQARQVGIIYYAHKPIDYRRLGAILTRLERAR